jgi:hypothetical protein
VLVGVVEQGGEEASPDGLARVHKVEAVVAFVDGEGVRADVEPDFAVLLHDLVHVTVDAIAVLVEEGTDFLALVHSAVDVFRRLDEAVVEKELFLTADGDGLALRGEWGQGKKTGGKTG